MSDSDTTIEVQGTRVPRLGFGTWKITGRAAEEAVRDALEIGYRQIDTARMYGNEAEIGAGIRAGGVDRGDVFLTTKLWMQDLEPARVRAAAEDSLRTLGTDYVDLLLIHWPNRDVPLERTLEAMNALREEGKIRNLGVSNFPAGLLAEALEHAPVLADQVEYHPFLDQDRLLELARERDVLVTAYSPLAQGRIFDGSTLERIGETHGKTGAQVALRWLLEQPNVSPIPKASSHERRVENFDVFDFELSDDERAEIDALHKDVRTADPEWAPDWRS
jgi:2,5-diketo-D-gluconate reductase B